MEEQEGIKKEKRKENKRKRGIKSCVLLARREWREEDKTDECCKE